MSRLKMCVLVGESNYATLELLVFHNLGKRARRPLPPSAQPGVAAQTAGSRPLPAPPAPVIPLFPARGMPDF